MVVWERLQSTESWEGVAGLHDLRDAVHDGVGDLTSFAFSIDTPLGMIRDTAKVTTAEARRMQARAEAKGIIVSVEIALTDMTGTRDVQDSDAEAVTDIDVVLDAQGSNFLTRPLAGTLRGVLEANIDREAERMVNRLRS